MHDCKTMEGQQLCPSDLKLACCLQNKLLASIAFSTHVEALSSDAKEVRLFILF